MKTLTNKQLQQIMVKSIISGLNLEKRPTRIASNEPKQLQMNLTTPQKKENQND
jgi:hypothetical protein